MDQYKPLNYYRIDSQAVLTQLRSDKKGLSNEEARERLQHIGANELRPIVRELAIVTFLKQLKNVLIVLLLVSAVISIFFLHDLKTGTILLVISLVNAFVGFIQEHKAETLMASIEKLVVPQAKVLRSGKLEEIHSNELVLGDIVYVESGDSVPADLRLIEEEELSTNDFALTGESNPTRKFIHAITSDVPIGNRQNLAYMGTTVATGKGYGVVVATGMQTELGRIANLSQTAKTDASPLQKEMSHLAIRLAQGTIILAAILVVIAIKAHLSVHDSLLFAIGIAAAIIPNGLATEVNVTLAQTADRMAKARALVKRLSSVETLGATTIIATDKTGTLTKNEMTAEQLLIGKTTYLVTGTGYEPNGKIVSSTQQPLDAVLLKELELFFATGVLASNARVDPPDNEHATWYVVGDPTEGALITLASKAGLTPDTLWSTNQEVKEFQFDAGRKRMSSARHWGKQTLLFVKGSPESVLEHSQDLWDHGHIRKLSRKDRQFFVDYNEKQAKKAMRNLALAYRVLPARSHPEKLTIDEAEQDLTFLGIVSIIDPLREQVPAAMAIAHNAHIKVSIVTGDYPTTAEAIARQAGLATEHQAITVVLGEDLRHLAETQILNLLLHGGVIFARVAPEDKLYLVNIAKRHGQVVAVTGDGINDAPALKRADIGVAMGQTGTDVAKEAAEIVLLDDSFDTLVDAIEQGRLTFQNIRKAARSALTDDAGELVAVLLSLGAQAVFHIPMAITAMQVLAIDVIAQIFPITALGWDTAEKELMHDRPRNMHDHIINWQAVKEFIGYGSLSAILAYINFIWFFERNHVSPFHASTASFLYPRATMLTYVTMVLCQFINLLFVRSSKSKEFFTKYLWSNKKLLIAFGFSFFCIANMTYNPWVRPYFGGGPLAFSDWLWAVAATGIYFVVRLTQRHTRQHTRKAVLKLHRRLAAVTN